MPAKSQTMAANDKVGLILRRIGAIRSRLNSLSVQQAVFQSLSLAICVGALVLLSAFALTPLEFLLVAIMLGTMLAVGLFRSISSGWRAHTTRQSAAQLADTRAELKGRLETIVALAENGAATGPLWAYLIEDATSRSDSFEPSRIEPRRISRAIYAFVAACLLAALAVPLALMNRRSGPVMSEPEMQLQIDVNNLSVRPADPDLDAGVEVTGDANAMASLADKLAQAQGAGGGREGGSLGSLMAKARSLGGDLQNRLTGRERARPRIHLRITDSGEHGNRDRGANGAPARTGPRDESGQFERQGPRADQGKLPPFESSQARNAQRAPNGIMASNPEQNAQQPQGVRPDDSTAAQLAQNDSDDSSGGGASHGSGSDPQNLFGDAQEPRLGSEGFQITIEARPAERGSSGQGRTYLPPKVRATLNEHQHPDEPIARSVVPDEDRATIKRIFER
jgi:hypothetical protein